MNMATGLFFTVQRYEEEYNKDQESKSHSQNSKVSSEPNFDNLHDKNKEEKPFRRTITSSDSRIHDVKDNTNGGLWERNKDIEEPAPSNFMANLRAKGKDTEVVLSRNIMGTANNTSNVVPTVPTNSSSASLRLSIYPLKLNLLVNLSFLSE